MCSERCLGYHYLIYEQHASYKTCGRLLVVKDPVGNGASTGNARVNATVRVWFSKIAHNCSVSSLVVARYLRLYLFNKQFL